MCRRETFETALRMVFREQNRRETKLLLSWGKTAPSHHPPPRNTNKKKGLIQETLFPPLEIGWLCEYISSSMG